MYLQKYQAKPFHCKSDGKEATSLPDITNCQLSDVFKQLRFKQVPTTVIGTCVGYIVWQSTTAAPQVQLQAGQCSHPAELVLRESLTL